MCSEERTLFKIISGLHTSISSHLTRFYKHSTNVALWAPLKNSKETNFHFNHTEYKARVLDHPDRVANLFFIYQMLALAVKEISPYLSQNFSVQSDHITEDL